jgi:hypothetical protein
VKKVSTYFVLMLLLTSFIFSQTPQYYNFNSGGTGNTIPFGSTGVSGYRSQWLIMPNGYNLPTPVPSGNKITKIYIRGAVSSGPIVCANLKIKLGQTADTTLPTTGAYTGTLDSVYFKVFDTVTTNAGGYAIFTLNTPYVYNPSMSLVIEISHCGFTGTGFSVYQYTSLPNKRTNSPGTTSCVFTWGSTDARTIHSGVDVIPATPTYALPNLIYYKFLNNPSATSVINYAVPGVGSNPATVTSLPLTSGGQFDSCLSGTGISSAKITTGYSMATGTSSFTISMWISNFPQPSTTRYIFGDAGFSFRCFAGGVAPTNGIVMRGTGVTDVEVTNILPGPTVVHLVYDSASSSVKIYKNGVYSNSVSQTPFNFTAGTGFTVGGYSSSGGIAGLLDEFRFYKRALDSAEIANTWNQNLGIITGIPHTPTSNIPSSYSLSQNYPNPFNPVTKISFDIPKNGFVSLKIYDLLGREVSTLVKEVKTPGSYIVDFDGASFASGTYFYRLESNGFVSTKKMLLIK